MSGVSKALFGSGNKVVNQAAQLYPETTYQADMRKDLTDVSSGLLDNASGYVSTGANALTNSANGILNGDTAANLQKTALENYNKQVGSLANNMAFSNLGSNSMTQNALAKAGSDATDWYMNNYSTALNNQANAASSLANLGLQSIQPASNLYNTWTGQQTSLSTPAQTYVKQGSSGLLGTALSGWASGGFK